MHGPLAQPLSPPRGEPETDNPALGVVDLEGCGIDRLAVEQVNARPIQRPGARRTRRKRGPLVDVEIAIDD